MQDLKIGRRSIRCLEQDPEANIWAKKECKGVKKAPNEELHSLYCSPNIVRVIKTRRLRWAAHVPRMAEGRSAFKILTGKPIGKRPLGRLRHRWEDKIRMDLKEIGINMRNWVDLAKDRDYWSGLVN